jgi:O-acetyl-ADP-ribose deacetylase
VVPAVRAIKGNAVRVKLGDLTTFQADAYVIPEFRARPSYGGVGGAVARAGGERGLAWYAEHVHQNGAMQFGEALLTASGGGHARYHLHVVSLASDRGHQFGVVENAFYHALELAAEQGIRAIVAPALGNGTIGHLTPEQSAKAMMAAVERHATDGKPPVDVTFVIDDFDDLTACKAFEQVLGKRLYRNVNPETGEKQFDEGAWVEGQIEDRLANADAGVHGDGGLTF